MAQNTLSNIWNKVKGPVWAFIAANWSTILLVAAGTFGLILFSDYKKQKQAVDELKKLGTWNDSVSNSKIAYYKDQFGKEHARVENLAVHDIALQAYTDSIAKRLKIKSDQISNTSATGTVTDINVKPNEDTIFTTLPCPGDSIKVATGYHLTYENPWVHITGSVGNGRDSLHFEATDTLKRTDYWKRTWFLGSKHYYSDITNTNPYVHVNGYKGVTLAGVTDQEKKWNLGLIAAYGYGAGKFGFFVGGGVMYSLKKL